MLCQRCGKKEGEWQCSVCRRIVCGDCKAAIGGRVYCLDHAPKGAVKRPGSALKMLAMTMAILTVTLATIYYATGAWIVMLQVPGMPPSVLAMVNLFSTTGMIFIIGSAVLTALLTAAYLAKRKKSNRENL